MAIVYLGLGSNVRPRENLRLAVAELRKRFRLLRVSPVYQSAAIGFDGNDFMNAVAAIESPLEPQDLCKQLDEIHERAGRSPHNGKLVSRTLDIDLLLYDQRVLDQPRLPRADVLEYAFVLRPLADIAPDLVHPVTGRSMREHWQAFDAGCHPLSEVELIL